MRHLLRLVSRTATHTALALALLMGAAAARAADVEGVLTVRWGDPLADTGAGEKLQAEIVGKNGYTYPIAAGQALEDGLPLFDMIGDDVVAVLDARQKSDGGYRLTGIASKSGSNPEPVSDARPWINLMCKFADVADEPTTVARMDAAFAPNGGMTRFWTQASAGFIDLSRTRSLGWFALPNPRSAYVDANNNPNLTKLLNDCASAASAALGDSLRTEDHAGVNILVNASLGCCAWGGNAVANVGGVSKTWRVTWVPPSGYLNLALLAHELGHAFGMPHSNNSDGDSSTYDNPWDLLSDSNGHAVNDNTFGRMPKTPAAYHLDRAGWLDADEKAVVEGDGDTTLALQRIDRAAPGTVRLLRIQAPGWTNGRYYTVETRMRGGEYDGALPDDGVVLYEVDPRRPQPAWLVDAQNPAASYSNTRSVVFKPGDSYAAPDGSFELRVLSSTHDGFQIQVVLPGPGFNNDFE